MTLAVSFNPRFCRVPPRPSCDLLLRADSPPCGIGTSLERRLPFSLVQGPQARILQVDTRCIVKSSANAEFPEGDVSLTTEPHC